MKQLFHAAVVTAAIALGSTAAMAQSVPPNPTNPIPEPSTGNGGLIFWAFDAVRGVSLTTNLGLRLDEILPATSNMTSGAGFTLDFGTLANYSSTFAASTLGNIVWGVGTADSLAPGLRVVATGPLDSTGLFMNVSGVTASAQAANGFIGSVNFACPGPSASCVVTDPLANGYAGNGEVWGANFALGLGWNATTNPGNALGFYYVTTPPGRPSSTSPAIIQQYANAAGVGQWLLTTAGNLTYSIPAVPLPAAAWLLLSGLLGLGVVSRRRVATAA
jgi:hypothetical protein